MSGPVCQAMPGRLATYRVLVADEITLRFIRLDVSAQKWIARTPGSEKCAASLRRFDDPTAAVSWLQEIEPAPGVGKRRAAA